MKVLLIAGFNSEQKGYSPALTLVNQQLFIDLQIRQIQSYGFNVDIVLDAHFADEILRKSKELANCEIIFDPRDNLQDPLSNYRAALYSTKKECFLMNVGSSCPEQNVWQKIIHNMTTKGYQQKADIARPYFPLQGHIKTGSLIYVSQLGRYHILKNNIQSFDDPSLNESCVPILKPTALNINLAQGENSQPLSIAQ